MGRVIHIDGVGKERKQLVRSVVLAIRGLMQQDTLGMQARDQAAYISLALAEISRTIDVSVTAWEKRGYWIKADRFRLEWSWSDRFAREMRQAVLDEDWDGVATIAARIAEKLQSVKLPQRNRLGTPWVGAWDKLRQK